MCVHTVNECGIRFPEITGVLVMPSFPPVIALTRGLDVLRAVNALGDASIAELHRHTGLHRPTVVRMLETLEHEGYVVRDSGSGRYLPAGRALQLSNGYRAHERIARIAEPVLAALRARVGWPSDVAIPDGDAMLIASTTRAFDRVLMNRRSGTRAPILGSALGRAYLAFCPDEERERIVATLRTSAAPFDLPARDPRSLARMLASVRRAGYSTPDPAYTRTVYNDATSGLGVPIEADGSVVAALNVVFFANAVARRDAVSSMLPNLREAAGKIGRMLATGAP